jgi:hypothetical protein
MYNPYLIQRAEIKTPLAPKDTRLSQAVNFDYMGSAEFEFGALPASFRAIETFPAHAWHCRQVPEITEGDTPLRVWSAFDDADFKDYVEFLKKARDTHSVIHTKEAVHFEKDRVKSKYGTNADFWWDIDNHVMFGFKKEFMKRVGDYVAASLKYMNEQ